MTVAMSLAASSFGSTLGPDRMLGGPVAWIFQWHLDCIIMTGGEGRHDSDNDNGFLFLFLLHFQVISYEQTQS